jgi:DNA modification methylase
METNKIYNMECVEGMKAVVPDKSVDLIITSVNKNLGDEFEEGEGE